METPPHPRRPLITFALLLGVFLAAIDVLIVAPAMPSVVADLGGFDLYPWVFAAYLLAATVSTPIYGRLADRHGRKPLYMLGLGLFLAGSALAGAAPGMGFLVAMRAVQGLGAGALLPTTLTLVGDLYPFEQRARMQGVFASVWGVASVVGPPVGGALVEHAGWRYVFYLNIPFGLLAGWLILVHLRHRKGAADDAHELDVPGAAALVLGLTLTLLALQGLGRTQALLDGQAAVILMLGLLLLAAFVARERRAAEPLVDPALLRSRIFLAANVGGFMGFGALYCATAFVPLLVRGVHGGSPQAAGLALMPLSLAWVVGSNVSGRLLLRAGYRVTVGLGVLFITGGTAGLVFAASGTDLLHLHGTLAVLGAGMGLAMTGFIVAVQGAAPPGRMGIATSSIGFFRNLGGAVGVAVLGAVLLAALRAQGVDPAQLSPLPGRSGLPPEMLTKALRPVFLAGLLFALGSLGAGVAMPGGPPRKAAEPTSEA